MISTETDAKTYYDSFASIINKNYPQGYQIALIKNPKYSDRSLLEQNYRYLTELVDCKEDEFLLDVGSGNGQFYEFLQSDEVYVYVRYTGIDASSEQVNISNSKFKNDQFLNFAMEDFFMLDPIMDHCFFIESIGYTENLDRTLKSLSTSLKTGANIVVKNPFKIIDDPESDLKYTEKIKDISKEYGYSEDSLGMIVDKKVLEDTFKENGFELVKFEIPEYDVETYNKTFVQEKALSDSHPAYIEHILGKNRVQNPSPKNKYYECGVFVFKKISNVNYDPFASKSEEYRNQYSAEIPNPESIDSYYSSKE